MLQYLPAACFTKHECCVWEVLVLPAFTNTHVSTYEMVKHNLFHPESIEKLHQDP